MRHRPTLTSIFYSYTLLATVLLSGAIAPSTYAANIQLVPSFDSTIDNDVAYPGMKDAIIFAVDRWNDWIANTTSSPVGEDATVEIFFNKALGTPLNDPIASARSEWYREIDGYLLTPPQTLTKNSNDINESGHDITVNIYPEHLGQTYFGTDGSPGGGQFDLVGTVLHEIGHAMGVYDTHVQWIDVLGFEVDDWGEEDTVSGVEYLSLWDAHLQDSAGNIASLANEQFHEEGDVFFTGFYTQDVLGRTAEIYSPSNYDNGSSLVHVDDLASGNYTLMNNAHGTGVALHGLWDYEVAMFKDLGWDLQPKPAITENGHVTQVTSLVPSWHDGNYWEGGLPPNNSTTVTLSSSATSYGRKITRNATAASLNIENNASLTINHHSDPSVPNIAGQLDVIGTVNVDGTLTIYSDGSSATLNIGNAWQSTGTVTLSGNSANWSNTNSLTVGKYGSGTLSIINGGIVNSGSGAIGATLYGQGETTVTGENSRLNFTSGDLDIGVSCTGTLNINDGAIVNVSEVTRVGYGENSNGSIHFIDGTLNTGSLFSSAEDLLGTGIINTRGLIADFDLVLDSSHALQQPIILNSFPGQQITINLSPSDLENVSKYSGAGHNGLGQLTISDGLSVFTWQGIAGYSPSSTGIVTITGPGSLWDVSGFLKIGDEGNGTLNIIDGGVVNNSLAYIGNAPGSVGTVTVEGSGSIWNSNNYLSIGDGGTGSITIKDGGEANSLSVFMRGEDTSTATITGTGSTWNIQDRLEVGYHSDPATLNIEQGGIVNSPISTIGYLTQGMVTVSDVGSSWNTHTAKIGESDDGILIIQNGGTVNNTHHSYISQKENSGTVTVTGEGSTWNNGGNVYVGPNDWTISRYFGHGTLNIETGGTVNIGGQLYLGFLGTGRGTINLNGGTLNMNGGDINFGINDSTFNITAGVLNMNGRTIWNGSNINFTGGTLNMRGGTIRAYANQDFVIDGGLLLNAHQIAAGLNHLKGILAPGGGIGRTTIMGKYTLNRNAILEIEFGGHSGVPGDNYDTLIVNGDITLDGLLNASMLGGYVPSIGNSFDVLTFTGSRTGTFDTLNLPSLNNIGLSVSYSSSAVTLTAGLLGDLNGDGFVGIEDLNTVLGNWNQDVIAGIWTTGDPSGDGFVGIEDLNLILGNWNSSSPPSGEAPDTVPEPATATLLLLLVMLLSNHCVNRSINRI